ncbi:MAG: relaxase/mobilization nuclease domain-containing protein [Oscillospiraceae bacterium]|nr:relaxase/mobilization nuclease domain-containing protein [Oscillospiraceae bacterium]
MAIVHFVNYKKPQTSKGMGYVLQYTMQDKKTVADDGNKYVTGVNCTPQSAYTEFNNTKRLYGKTDSRLFYHFVQSFSVDENMSPQMAHEIAVRFAEETEKFHGFEIVVSTHCDRDHIHSHFVMNSVNAESGRKFHISESEVEMLMQKSDALCLEYGLSVLKPKAPTERAKPMNDREYRSAEKGESWKIRLEAIISNAMKIAADKEHFIMLMEAEGYGVKWTDTRKNITYTTPEGKACRDSKLHLTKFLKESMEYEFLYRAEITARINNPSTTTNHHRRKGSSLRGGDRTELDGNDIYTESTDKTATGYSEHPAYADDRERTESVYGRATEGADAVHRADQNGDRAVSDSDGNIGGGIDQEHWCTDNRYRETGWENERELFEQHLYASQYGGGQTGEAYEQAVLDISDTFGGAHSVGTDTAYLIGDIGNIIDEDAPVEDCTTKHYPAERKKKQGPVMSGM